MEGEQYWEFNHLFSDFGYKSIIEERNLLDNLDGQESAEVRRSPYSAN